MTVDGATFDRPQIGPAYDADPEKKFDRTLRELYLREHFQPITNSGGLHLVYDRDELNQAIADAMEKPQERSEGRKKIVSEICTYADGKSSLRVVDTLKELMIGRVEVRSSQRLLPELKSTKPRVLIPVIQHFAVRYLLRTGMLEEISRFAQPIAAISWDDPALIRELNRIGVECVPLPPFRFGSDFRVTRERVNSWHRVFRKTTTLPIDRRRENSLLGTRDMISVNARRIMQDARLILPGELERLLALNERLLWSDTNAYEYESILKSTRADVVFSITPYTNREEPLLRAAKKNNLTCYTAILSFDNITTRTWLPITFDHYLLWNKYNASELVRAYPDADPNEITVTGPPQFDFYWDKSYVWDEKDWRKAHGIPAGRPAILFGGGSHLVVPHEELWLRELDEEISQGNIPGNPIILFRRHPGDIAERWTSILANARNVVLDEPWQAKENNGLVNITRRDIEDLTSTLYHANVHINASSTLTVDGAIFDRPQIGPAYDADRRKKFDRVLKDLYIREHYLPITNSGGLDVVYSREQLVSAVNTAFDDPAARTEGRKKLVSEICTYADGKSSQRVVTKLKDLLS
jgi:CDP-glycerol glycerophosphotransferase (TagB/SpsB family)